MFKRPVWPPEGFLTDIEIQRFDNAAAWNWEKKVALYDDLKPHWRHVYKLLSLVFNTRRSKRPRSGLEKMGAAMMWLLYKGTSEMSVAVLKSLLAVAGTKNYLQDLPEVVKPEFAPWLLDYWAKHRPEQYGSLDFIIRALGRLDVPCAYRRVLEVETSRPNYRDMTPDGMMRESTAAIFRKLPLREILSLLIEPLQPDVHLPEGEADLVALIVQVAFKRYPPISFDIFCATICVLLLYHLGKLELLLDNLCGIVELEFAMALGHLVEATFDSNPLVPAKLRQIFQDESRLPMARFHAASVLMLRKSLDGITEADVRSIPGYPRPWAHPNVPLPDRARAGILKYFATEIDRGTDPRLVLEAGFLDAPVPEDSASWNGSNNVQPKLDIAGCVGFGPISAGNWFAQGSGNYNLYKIYCTPPAGVPEGPTPVGLHLATCAVSCLGPFYFTSTLTYDHPAKKPAEWGAVKEIPAPTLDEANQAFAQWAAQNGWSAISAELGELPFDGLITYFFGRREPLRVRDLLFYWQD